MPKRLKKISEKLLHKNPWWEYKHDTYEKPNGEVGDYYYGETGGVVVIVPIMADGRIVLTLQHRYLKDKQSIEFSAGGILKNMTNVEAAKKELLEETGCVAKEFIKVGVFEPANGFIKDTTHVFLAHVTEQGEQQPDDTEEIELLYRRPKDIEEMIKKNEIWDGQTMATWALVRHNFISES
jgi:ADP-ribose pyrophosphatase